MMEKVALAVLAVVAVLGGSFGCACLAALALQFFWGLGVVPFGAPALSFWQAWGLAMLVWFLSLGVLAPATIQVKRG